MWPTRLSFKIDEAIQQIKDAHTPAQGHLPWLGRENMGQPRASQHRVVGLYNEPIYDGARKREGQNGTCPVERSEEGKGVRNELMWRPACHLGSW